MFYFVPWDTLIILRWRSIVNKANEKILMKMPGEKSAGHFCYGNSSLMGRRFDEV